MLLMLGCSDNPTPAQTLAVDLTGPTQQLVSQVDSLSQGWRAQYGASMGAPTLSRREVRHENLPSDAVGVGAHIHFEGAIAARVEGFRDFYFGALSPWQSIQEASTASLWLEIQEREDLHITTPESMWVGCWSRAMLISKVLDEMGLHSKKIWIQNPRAGIGPDEMWAWHVATAIQVERSTGEVYIAVLDPAADATKPLPLEKWLAMQNLQELPVLVVEPLTTRWPNDDALRLPLLTHDHLPDLNHITLQVSPWQQYSIEKCEGSPCREDQSVADKVEIARGELERGGA